MIKEFLARLNGPKDDHEAAKIVLEAYLVMLRMPPSSPLQVMAAQKAMARCRDFVADTLGLDSEYVQNACADEVAKTTIPAGMRMWVYDPPPYSLEQVELWREGWESPQRSPRSGLPPQMNVHGLYWREVPT